MTRRTLDPEKLVKIHIYNNLLAYYSETCLSIFVPKRQRIFVPLSHFDVRVIHSRSDGTHKIANIYGSRDALPIPLYIISEQTQPLSTLTSRLKQLNSEMFHVIITGVVT